MYKAAWLQTFASLFFEEIVPVVVFMERMQSILSISVGTPHRNFVLFEVRLKLWVMHGTLFLSPLFFSLIIFSLVCAG